MRRRINTGSVPLIVAPITEPKKGGINAGAVDRMAAKGHVHRPLYRYDLPWRQDTDDVPWSISTIPVLAKAGAIAFR